MRSRSWGIALFGLLGCGGSQDAPRMPGGPPASASGAVNVHASATATTSAPPPAATPPVDWIARSNENARILLAIQAKFSPESAARLGVDGVDENVIDLGPGHEERFRAAIEDAARALRAKGDAETDPGVKQDLDILVHAADLVLRVSRAEEQYEVPYVNVTRLVFGSMESLLDEQIPASRRAAALTRIKRYAGIDGTTQPLAELAKSETRAKLGKPGLAAPSRLALEDDLRKNARLRDGVEQLLSKYAIAGYEEPWRALAKQLEAYDDYVKREVLPRARTTFALPPPLYALALERFGVDLPEAELVALAHRAFGEIQAEMQTVAAQIAEQRHMRSKDYRDVIRELKKEQLEGDAILPHYKQRLAEIEAIIRDHKLVTLPTRPARIRLGTPAENAAQPAPHMRPPRLLGNTGEQGEFVLPTVVAAAPGSREKESKLDDFTYAAASWTLTAHEARPGHELQFASLVERGVSVTRAVYAFNSTNVEGWGLYSEHITYPYMPLEGKLISLQLRLQRAVRAFIDPELQQGKWTPESARAYLQREVVLSSAMANAEVERYTVRNPGQATSYFYGYIRLLELRRGVELRLGAAFDALKFHDFILAQGLLPPHLMRAAVMKEFVN